MTARIVRKYGKVYCRFYEGRRFSSQRVDDIFSPAWTRRKPKSKQKVEQVVA